jgi:hypothetical protein
MKSKFADIFAARKSEQPEPAASAQAAVAEPPPAPPQPAEPEAHEEAPAPAADIHREEPAEPRERKRRRVEAPARNVVPPSHAIEGKRIGRPPGKRSDPAFVQVTAYIRRDTHLAVQRRLLDLGKTQEFSEVVEETLRKWLKAGT